MEVGFCISISIFPAFQGGALSGRAGREASWQAKATHERCQGSCVAFVAHFVVFFHDVFSISCRGMFQRLRMFWRRSMVLTVLKISFILSFPRQFWHGSGFLRFLVKSRLFFFLDFTFFFQVWFPHQTRLEYPRDDWDWELSRWLLMQIPEANSLTSQKIGKSLFNFTRGTILHQSSILLLIFLSPQNFYFSKSAFVTAWLDVKSTLTIHGWSKVFRNMWWDMDSTNRPACWRFCFPYSTCSDPCAVDIHDMTSGLRRWPTHHKEYRWDAESECESEDGKGMLLQIQALLQWMLDLRSRYFMSICIYSIQYTLPFFTKTTCIGAKFGWYGCTTMFEHHLVSTSSPHLKPLSVFRRVRKSEEELRCFARLRGQFFLNGFFCPVNRNE